MNWYKNHKDGISIGDKLADKVAKGMGSWSFIIIQSLIVIAWMILNVLGFLLSLGCISFYFIKFGIFYAGSICGTYYNDVSK